MNPTKLFTLLLLFLILLGCQSENSNDELQLFTSKEENALKSVKVFLAQSGLGGKLHA